MAKKISPPKAPSKNKFAATHANVQDAKILPRKFYARDTPLVARDLLGKLLVRQLPDGTILSGIITETEAYRSDDPACHAHSGKTERNKSLFGPVGHAYVYRIYGIHWCVNLVAHDKSKCQAGGVLIRAIIPQEGTNQMIKNRGYLAKITNKKKDHSPLARGAYSSAHPALLRQGFVGSETESGEAPKERRRKLVEGCMRVFGIATPQIKNLTNGPGKVAQALEITRDFDGVDVTRADSPLIVTEFVDILHKDIAVTPRIGISRATETLWRFLLK